MKLQLLIFFFHILSIFSLILLRIYIGFLMKIIDFGVVLMLNYKNMGNISFIKISYSLRVHQDLSDAFSGMFGPAPVRLGSYDFRGS